MGGNLLVNGDCDVSVVTSKESANFCMFVLCMSCAIHA